MKEIETIHAEGHVICHDITVIIKDEIKEMCIRDRCSVIVIFILLQLMQLRQEK